jgi:hypothetical protein
MNLVAITVNYRTAPGTLRALPSLVAEVAAVDGRVIVVDNDSQDGSFEILCRGAADLVESSRVEVVASGKNGGFGFGNNVGIRRAFEADPRPKYLLFINPDAVPQPGAVARLVAYLEAHPEVGIAGSALRSTDGHRDAAAFRFPSILGELEAGARLGFLTRLLERWVIAPPAESPPDPPDWVSGTCFMVRTRVLDEVGCFDEGFFLYFEETELCYRIRHAGWQVATVPDSLVVHDDGTSTGIADVARRMPRYWFESRRRFFVKAYGPGYHYAATLMWALGFASWRIRRRLQGKPDTDRPHLLEDFLRYSLGPNRQVKEPS